VRTHKPKRNGNIIKTVFRGITKKMRQIVMLFSVNSIGLCGLFNFSVWKRHTLEKYYETRLRSKIFREINSLIISAFLAKSWFDGKKC